ncbi:hypothetical protein QYE76_013368 [Lolium multiflorum]|uniref:Uncharacterized protein n=1 Tax=Lolium multiflorum TaxID=4521 RepID=A0AAD8U0J1_LOLMU|nr:hypothetical protein QYE76_013368 [Lolium multiflorum]
MVSSQRQEPPAWFVAAAILGAFYMLPFLFRLLARLALCLRRPKDLRRRYGAWAVVTGPTSGIGRSMALELARRGLNLVLVDLNAANLREISETIGSLHGVQTRTVVFDLSLVSTPQGDEAMARLREAVAGLDVGVLVNNAGVATPGSRYLHEADAEAWVSMIRVNLWAVTEVTAAVLPGMVARGRGAVVNMGSASSEAIPSFPLYTIYASTKRYVAQLSRSLYVEYRSKGIDVQCQAPFYVATQMASMLKETGRVTLLLIAPTPDAYARAAVRWIGHGPPLCTPNVGHQLFWCLVAVTQCRRRHVAPKAEAEASATASEAEQLVKEPEVEDLKEGGAQGLVAAADLEKPEAEAAVVEEGGAGAAAPVLADIVDQKAEAEEGVAVRGPADAGKGKEEVVVREAEVEDPYTAWAGEGSRKRKREEEEPVPPPIQELEPVPPPIQEEEVAVPPPIQEEEDPLPAPAVPAPAVPAPPVPAPYEELEDSDGSLEYDSQDSSESVDSRNIGSFKRKLLQKLEAGDLPFKKRGRYFCPWHKVKPRDGKLHSLRQHCEELAHTGTSKQIRAEHQGLLMVLAMEDA